MVSCSARRGLLGRGPGFGVMWVVPGRGGCGWWVIWRIVYLHCHEIDRLGPAGPEYFRWMSICEGAEIRSDVEMHQSVARERGLGQPRTCGSASA